MSDLCQTCFLRFNLWVTDVQDLLQRCENRFDRFYVLSEIDDDNFLLFPLTSPFLEFVHSELHDRWSRAWRQRKFNQIPTATYAPDQPPLKRRRAEGETMGQWDIDLLHVSFQVYLCKTRLSTETPIADGWAGAVMSQAGTVMIWARALTATKYSYLNFFTFKQLKNTK